MFQMSTAAAAAVWLRGLAQIVRAWRRLCHCRNWGRAVFLGARRMSCGCTGHAALVEVVEVVEVAEVAEAAEIADSMCCCCCWRFGAEPIDYLQERTSRH